MDQNEVLKMAKQAGFEGITSHEWVGYTNSLEAFAKLVAVAAASKEREACAKVCDDIHAEYEAKDSFSSYAEAIRARGETALRGEA